MVNSYRHEFYGGDIICTMRAHGDKAVWHREDGPAFHCVSGLIMWFLFDRRIYYTQEYCEECGFSEEETIIWLLKYGNTLPTHIDQL